MFDIVLKYVIERKLEADIIIWRCFKEKLERQR